MNFNIEAIDDIESTENYYAFVFHANFEELRHEPPIRHPKINHFIGVSDFATEKADLLIQKLGKEGKAERCYNPLTLEPKEKVLHLCSACRLDDKVKGGDRTLKLIKALDRYCEKTGRHYIWHIFTNTKNRIELPSKNVVYMEPRVDVRPYIADSDYVLQLSNDMETYCYTINEALGYGVPIVTTPLSILNELPITDNEHIVLDWDCSNVDEVAKQIFEKKVKKFEYEPPQDDWDKFLVEGKGTYSKEIKQKVKVKGIIYPRYFDIKLQEHIKFGQEFEVMKLRADDLVDKGLVEIIEEEQNSIK